MIRLRRQLHFAAVALAVLVVLASPAAVRAQADASAERVARARDRVLPALVNISVVAKQFEEGREVRFPEAGSGVIVTAAGHVLTNFHVAGHATRIRCTLASGEVVEADVVANDPLTDLSVLKLRRAGDPAKLHPLQPARLAPEKTLAVGDPVLALGNPFALSSSVTLGIVSNPRRVFTNFTGTELEEMDLGDGEVTGLFTLWIQHDALILPGNSGGPLVDLEGDLVGINELGGDGIGFAIPARVAASVLDAALADGKVRRSFIGILALPVAKLEREEGALVSAVLPGSPAAEAGVEAGDLLLAVDGSPVAARFFEQIPELYQRLAAVPIGSQVRLTLDRAGTRRDLQVRTTEMERALGEEGEFRRLGVTAQELTAPMALVRHWAARSGLLVTGVRPGESAANAKPPLEAHDLLTAIDGKPVRDLSSLAAALEAAKNPEMVLSVRRDDEELLSVATLPAAPSGRWGGELPKAWLGLRTQVVTPELARALGEPDLHGFRVTEVYPGTEAAKSGLAPGDLLLALDGEPLTASRRAEGEDLQHQVEERSIGDVAKFGVRRGREAKEISVRLETRPEAAEEARTGREEALDFSVRDLVPLDAVKHHWDATTRGVLVTDVASGGWAHMAGLKADDLILAIDGHAVDGVAAFETSMKAIEKGRPPRIQFFVRRGYRTDFVFLEPEWPRPPGATR